MNNNTKKITTGAMMLAIIGALLLIDRALSYAFTTFILTVIPSIIVIYAAMYEFKDGMIFSVALLILGFVINPTISFLVYIITGSIVGVGYSYGVKKNFDRRRLLLIAIFLYVVAEVITIALISPILGFGGLDEMVTEMQVMVEEVMKMSGSGMSLESIGYTASTLKMIAGLGVVITGVLEGLLVHLLSLILLKRFKIMDIMKGGTLTFNLNAPVSYVLMLLVMSFMMFYQRIDNETIKNILMCGGLISGLVLMYYGYIVSLTLVRTRFPQNKRAPFYMLLLVIFLLPTSFYLLIIVGFLYGAGPIKRQLINKGKQI